MQKRSRKAYYRAGLFICRSSSKFRSKSEFIEPLVARNFKKGGSLLFCEKTGVKYRIIDTTRKAYTLILLCKMMRVSRSGYYSGTTRAESPRQQERERLLPRVKDIHRQSRESYGARRVSSRELHAQGEVCARTIAGTLMKLAGVSAKQKKILRPRQTANITFQ